MTEEEQQEFDSLTQDEKIIYLYAEGAGDAEVCKGLEISKEDFDLRCKQDAAFKRLISFGRTISQARWEEMGRLGAFGKEKVNAQVYNMFMKNRYGWADKSEMTTTDILSVEGMTQEEAHQKLRELMPKAINLIEQKQAKH